jgi:Holliday junction resolvase RusA-like endonuclease
LTKATEDALQNIVILNDRLVVHIEATRVIGGKDGAYIRVYRLEAS